MIWPFKPVTLTNIQQSSSPFFKTRLFSRPALSSANGASAPLPQALNWHIPKSLFSPDTPDGFTPSSSNTPTPTPSSAPSPTEPVKPAVIPSLLGSPATMNPSSASQLLQGSAPLPSAKSSAPHFLLKLILGLSLIVVLGTGAFIGMNQLGWLPSWQWVQDNGSIYNANGQFTYTQAQEQYRHALQALNGGDPQKALNLLNEIEQPYNGLRPFIWLHQADAQSRLGHEGQAQTILKRWLSLYEKTPMGTLGQYKLGQSYLRSGEPKKAELLFNQAISTSPNTNIALGCHYYLGKLAAQTNDKASAQKHWLTYLKGSTSGLFSMPSVDGLIDLKTPLSSDSKGYIGLVWAEQKNYAKAIPYLTQGQLADTWVSLATAYQKTGQTDKARSTLIKGFPEAKAADDAQKGIELLVATTPSASLKPLLIQLLHQPGEQGHDFVMWELMQNSQGTSKTTYAETLLTDYSTSDWAPETSWYLTWQAFQAGQWDEFSQRAKTHLTKYPYSRSAPRVMYWQAKLQQLQNQSAQAKTTLSQLIEQYPYQYYAYRAKAMLEGSSSPWQTQPSTRLSTLASAQHHFKPDPLVLAQTAQEPSLNRWLSELIRVDAADDVDWVLNTMDKAKVPAPLSSWVAQGRGQRFDSITLATKAIDAERREGPLKDSSRLTVTRQLAYPVHFSDLYDRFAAKNHLDPFWALALTRQESYFNTHALSSSQAMGLMQLIPSTANSVAQWEKIPTPVSALQLFEPALNIQLGTRYLGYLQETFNQEALATGSYNGGPGAMKRWLADRKAPNPQLTADWDYFIETIPYEQTRTYIKEVFSHYWNYRSLWK